MPSRYENLKAAPRPRPGPNDRISFHTPRRFAEVWPYQVLVAGKTHFSRNQAAITYRFHAHTLIYTLSGRGVIEVGGQASVAETGSIAWIDTSARYAHRCHPEEDVWEYLWFSMQGYGIDAVFSHLQAGGHPVFNGLSKAEAAFSAALENLSEPQGASDAASSQHVAEVLAHLANAREAQVRDSSVGGRVQLVMDKMRADLSRNWTVEILAEIAELSASQLFRQFRRKTATTPLDWLRHERMSLAKRGLVETEDFVWQVAERCGYPDPYHFSRDFKRIVGQSPSEFRATHGTALGGK